MVFRPRPPKSPRPEAQVLREQFGVAGAMFLNKTFQFRKRRLSVINIFPSVGNLSEVFRGRVHGPFLVLGRRNPFPELLARCPVVHRLASHRCNSDQVRADVQEIRKRSKWRAEP
jgi:hypothetical protein